MATTNLIIDEIDIAESNGETVAFNATCSLDRRDVRQVIEALKRWLETASFPSAE